MVRRWGVAAWTIALATVAAEAGRLQPRTYGTGVPLIAGGQATCVVICPAEKNGWPALAERVADAVTALGASDVPIVLDTSAVPERLGSVRPDLQARNLILLGDLNTNRAFFPLYANYYTYCDARYPGRDGYVLRTIVRPFGRKANYLLIGGSTQEGVAAGVDRLVAKLGKLEPGSEVELPYELEVKLGPEMARILDPLTARAGRETDSDPPEGEGRYGYARDRFTANAHLHFYTGEEVFAETARKWALYLADYDSRAIRIDDYKLENLAAAWRRVSPSPVFMPDERQKIDTRMYETAVEQEGSWWRQKDASQGIGMRHHTTGMLGWWTLIRVLLELGQPDDPARRQLIQWRSECEAYLNGLLRHYWDDADDYQSADSVQNTASYALQTGQLSWFESGLGHRAAERLLSVTDNLGWYAGIQGYGEALPGWEHFTLNGGLLLGSCGFVYQDGGFNWILKHFAMLERSWGALQPWWLHQYATGDRLRQAQPGWLNGLQVTRFTPYRLNHINTGRFLKTDIMDGFRVTGLAARPVSEGRAFDKLVIRGSPGPSSLYLLLQGSSAITLSTIDMNSIIRYTDQGKLWLLHNTSRRSLFFKNAVYISKGANDQPLPAACELMAHADLGDVALAATRLPAYRGTTWTRNLIVLHDRFSVVIDQIRADEPGYYKLCCTWRTPGFAALTGSGWESRQEDVEFCLLPGEMNGLTSNRSGVRDGATRPTVLRQNRSWSAAAGDNLVFENLLYTTGPARRQTYRIRRVAPGAIVIRQPGVAGDNSLYLAAASDRDIELKGLKTDAAAILLGPQDVCMTGGTKLLLDGMGLTPAAGRTVPTEELAERIRHLLAELWADSEVAEKAATDTGESASGTGPEPLWVHGGPCSHGGLIEGVRLTGLKNVIGPTAFTTDWILPVLRAEPRLSPQKGCGLALESPNRGKAAGATTAHDAHAPSETMLSPLKGAEFVLEFPRPMRIDELAIFGDTLGETSNPLPRAELDLALTFSCDGFRRDKRTRKVSLTRRATYHNLYKGHSYVFECYSTARLNEQAGAVRIRVLSGPSAEMMLSDVQLRTADTARAKMVEVRPADLDDDERDEILTWTSEGDLVVVRADGTECWRKRWPQGIIAVDAWDLEDDGMREVFVSRTDRHVVVLNHDGSLRWERDFSNMYRETDERFYGDGSEVYGMAAWQRAGATEKEVLLTSYWFTARLDPKGRMRECFRRGGHFTQIRCVPPGLPGSGDLVIRSDIPWVGPVPLEWWSTAAGEADATCKVPNGPAVFLEVDDYDGDGKAEALVATEQGVGLYARTEPRTRWQHMTEAPPAGVGVIREPSEESASIVYGRQDGYIFVLAADGTLLGRTVLDEPIRCLTALRTSEGNTMILVGTGTSLRCLRWGDLKELWRRPGAYQHLELVRCGGGRQVLAVRRTGQLEMLSMGNSP